MGRGRGQRTPFDYFCSPRIGGQRMALRRTRGGDRPRRWAPEAVRAGSRGTPQTATRGTQPGAPGRARGGPASPARPPAEAGWRRLGAPAGVPPRQDPGAGGRDPAAGDRGWSDLGVGGTKGAEATLRRPQPRPGKSPGAIDDRATLRQA
ncbi:hypothetical protein NDU88_006321 [Pleurodeles waltl]|uniref:Uncharacterized protein n=1 Tax=Pleurodeles waltl TaxID=8319 RepID=A0AAV7TDL0_PLEWA|nr:hypothetical protein NDU88_006321 [Pleurodeles waltl]